MKPLFLLDIDGVCNALSPARGGSAFHKMEVDGYTIRYRQEWEDWVGDLAALSTPIWATMWQERAITHFAPATGIGKMFDSFIHFSSHYSSRNDYSSIGEYLGEGGTVAEYKHPGIVATAGDRPFLWVDDDIDDWQFEWAAERDRTVPTMLIRPNRHVGLTDADYLSALRFLTQVRVA